MERDALLREIDAVDDWASKTIRTHELVREHGAIVSSVTEGRWETGVGYFDLDAAPDDCPWRLGSRDARAAIAAIFAPIASEVPTVVSALSEACHSVVARRDAEGRWALLYYVERRRREAMCVQSPEASNARTLFVGGAPCAAPSFGEAARALGWSTVPSDLRRFAAIHDGLGRESAAFGVGAILPVSRMEPRNEGHPEWLEVRCDSAGNRRVLYRDRAAESMTLEWDRETQEISEAMPFFSWLERRLSLEILDLSAYDFPDGPYR